MIPMHALVLPYILSLFSQQVYDVFEFFLQFMLLPWGTLGLSFALVLKVELGS
jgi:hypothetical protein